jgi:hypothetical protein
LKIALLKDFFSPAVGADLETDMPRLSKQFAHNLLCEAENQLERHQKRLLKIRDHVQQNYVLGGVHRLVQDLWISKALACQR